MNKIKKYTGEGTPLEWKCNTHALLREIVECHPSPGPIVAPVNILMSILSQLATRCSQLNDPVLNHLMCRLALYDVSDQYSEGYNADVVEYVEIEFRHYIKNYNRHEHDRQD